MIVKIRLEKRITDADKAKEAQQQINKHSKANRLESGRI
jgi:hypothetical protein